MKRIKTTTFEIWIANVIDAEDMAIRKRTGLPVSATAYDYHGYDPQTQRPISDYEQGLRRPSGATHREGT